MLRKVITVGVSISQIYWNSMSRIIVCQYQKKAGLSKGLSLHLFGNHVSQHF